MTHKTQKIDSGAYLYRGFMIEKYDPRGNGYNVSWGYSLPEDRGGDGYMIDASDTLTEAKKAVDYILSRELAL